MNSTTHQRRAIWNIADDVLRDLYVRGKYRDVILPMTVLRRLDSVLDTTKQDVLSTKKTLDAAKIELLREFHTRLTSDVVTGQVDVREIAATLPELTDDVLASADDEFGDGDPFFESVLEFAGADE